MNKGIYFSSSRKAALTVVNLLILVIACALVSYLLNIPFESANASLEVWHGPLGIG